MNVAYIHNQHTYGDTLSDPYVELINTCTHKSGTELKSLLESKRSLSDTHYATLPQYTMPPDEVTLTFWLQEEGCKSLSPSSKEGAR